MTIPADSLTNPRVTASPLTTGRPDRATRRISPHEPARYTSGEICRALRLLFLCLASLPVLCAPVRVDRGFSHYLFVWARPADKAQPDFLAVIDALPQSPSYGRVLTAISAGFPGMAHHTNYQMPANGILFANDYDLGLTFRFDLRQPRAPKLLGHFGAAGIYTHPHSFVRLPSGNLLATYQTVGEANSEPGALVELDPEGKVLRASAAAAPNVEKFIRPYSLAVVPALDRVVTTSFDMYETGLSHVVQIWRLKDLRLLKTIRLPAGPRPELGESSAEPRLLADGRTVLVSTFTCGLYRIAGLGGNNPEAVFLHDFGGKNCAVPVVAGRYWYQPMGDRHEIVTLDISNLSRPREISQLTLGPKDFPHWLALEPSGRRIVLTGYFGLANQVVVLAVGPGGRLAVDQRFHHGPASEPGVRLDMEKWPHGGSGPAIPHGAVFSNP